MKCDKIFILTVCVCVFKLDLGLCFAVDSQDLSWKDGGDDGKTTKSQSKPAVSKILGERNKNDHESGESIDQVDDGHLHLGKRYMYINCI